jgi:hypothetical protein
MSEQAEQISERLKTMDKDAPLRLETAAKLAFPNGGMTVAGLRTQIKRGHLTVETIAGKHFVTLRAIEEMRTRCRVKAEDRISISKKPTRGTKPSGSSEIGLTDAERIRARDAALARANKIEVLPSPNTAPSDTTPRPKAEVIQIKH